MPTTVEDVTAKAEMVEIEPKSGVALKSTTVDHKDNEAEPNGDGSVEKEGEENKKDEAKVDEVPVPDEVETKSGISFPGKLDDGKLLKARYNADNENLRELVTTKVGKAPSKPTKDMYQMVIDSDVGMMVRLVIVYSSLTMNMVRKNFDEGLGAAIKKLTGGKNEELTKKIMGEASDEIKLTPGSTIEISRLPGYLLQTKVMGEIVSTVESELLCRAYIYMYLGEDPFDKEAKEKFGTSLLSLF
ncbi:Fatty-acid-binding protein 1 [Abeliophyllum distichum]|uniref:Fatty-acid-binding protein 1 n=1 Tax=Abeliophyllum distichum TaxID=126358 RepID=A0ABD1SIA1_9LAMI